MINQDGEIYFNEFNIMMVNAYKNVDNRNNINYRSVSKCIDKH